MIINLNFKSGSFVFLEQPEVKFFYTEIFYGCAVNTADE